MYRFVLLTACILTIGMAFGLSQVSISARISPVPVYPVDGILPAELLDQYVFLRRDGSYIVSYPESLGTPSHDRRGRRAIQEIDFPNHARPVVHSSVERLPGARYRYKYRVQSAVGAKQGIRRLLIEVRAPRALEDVRPDALPPTWGYKTRTPGDDNPQIGIELETATAPLAPSMGVLEFAFDSYAKPGLTRIYAFGATEYDGVVASLPQEVRSQIEEAKRLGLSPAPVYGLGPKHPPDRNYYAVAADFIQMIRRSGTGVPGGPSEYFQALESELSKYMESVRNSTTEIEGITLPKPQLELEQKPQTELDSAVSDALRLCLDME